MKPAPFKYHDPRTIPEALGLLGSLENTKLLAGGQSLVPMLNFRFLMPDHLIDLNRVDGLSGISIQGRRVKVGAMTRQRALERDEALHRACPIVREALREVGHFQTRNRGTLGGSLAHLDPAAELPGVMALYDAEVEVSGSRKIAMKDWGQGYMTPNLQPDEMITSVSWDAWDAPHGHAFVEFARRRGDFALAAAGCLLSFDGRKIRRAALVLTGIQYAPIRLQAAEDFLKGNSLSEEAIREASAAAQKVEAKSDVYASAAYRQRLAGVMVERALRKAGGQANH